MKRRLRLAANDATNIRAPRARPAASPPGLHREAVCRFRRMRTGRRRRTPRGCSASASVGSVVTRPTRSSGTLSDLASGDAATPAAHNTVCAAIASPPTTTPSSSICDDGFPADHFNAQFLAATGAPARAAFREKVPRTSGPPSTNRIRADSGRMLRKSCGSDCRAISASAPASSTPVGPAPTITNVRSRRRLSASGSRSAAS